jgi:L-ribulokinase
MKFSIGLDYGTNSVRALLVNCRNGEELATCVFDYPSGHQGILIDPKNSHLARQNPADYLEGIEYTITGAIAEAHKADPAFDPSDIIGIGVDSTGSSPIPVNAENTALACLDEFKENLAAHCWLWKDHTSYKEAAKITEIARKERPQYVAKCGNTYSSEWWWSKLWHCLNSAPEVFDAAYSWVELADWVPAILAGIKNPLEVKRGVCAAGHKAFYADEWSGLPDDEFLSMLDPKLADLKKRLYTKAYNASEKAGYLCSEWANKLGLKEGIPVAIGEFDVHYGAIGSGIKEGTLVKAMGTSTCDCSVVKLSDDIADIPGICGIVKESILPGFYGVEAGQSAVGDLFKWWVEVVCKGEGKTHKLFREEVQKAKPGAAGLLALDWNNGNRTVLVDQRLTGLILGQTLHSSQAEIYRALIEATAFGARMIIERLEKYGVPIETVVCCGGIAEKDPLTMQIYADVTGRTMRISRSAQTCALGAAIGAAVVAGAEIGGYDDYDSAQAAMTGLKDMVYTPIQENHEIYNRLFKLYQDVHDSFGGVKTTELGHVMKELLDIKESQLS